MLHHTRLHLTVAASAIALAATAVEARAAGGVAERRAALVAAQNDVVDAALAAIRGDAVGAAERAAAAEATLLGARAASRGSVAAAIGAASRDVAQAVETLAASDVAADATDVVFAFRRAATSVRRALRRAGTRGAVCALAELGPGPSAMRAPGSHARFRVGNRSGNEALGIDVTNDAAASLETEVVALGRGRFRVRWADALGGARAASQCVGGESLRLVNLGPDGALAAALPETPDYGGTTRFARVGTAFTSGPPQVAGSGPYSFSAGDTLPDGLSLDLATGAISGTPTASGPAATFRITVSSARGAAWADVVLDVDPALPAGVIDLAGGFAIDTVVVDEAVPVKLAPAPDGSVFFSELTTGDVRRIRPDGSLAPQAVAHVDVLHGPEQGLLGIAAAPDFAESGHIYVFACTPADAQKPDRNRILRFTVSGDDGAGPEVVVDDLPIGVTSTGGHLAFAPDGMLFVSIGDTGNSALAQTDGSLAGRILRYAPDGTVPAGNPVAGSPEWARGFRNVFGFAFQPGAGGLFATENGPAAHDELDYVLPGRNFEWGAAEDEHFGALTGIRLVDWTPVIVPTGIAFQATDAFGPEHAGDLYLASYDHAHVRRLVLDGIDVLETSVLVQLDEEGIAQKPLDVAVAADGALWISTFTTIWRVRRD